MEKCHFGRKYHIKKCRRSELRFTLSRVCGDNYARKYNTALYICIIFAANYTKTQTTGENKMFLHFEKSRRKIDRKRRTRDKSKFGYKSCNDFRVGRDGEAGTVAPGLPIFNRYSFRLILASLPNNCQYMPIASLKRFYFGFARMLGKLHIFLLIFGKLQLYIFLLRMPVDIGAFYLFCYFLLAMA